jgi:glutathione synthase/RimK-type ligase-like ATP-grasp enzyme
MDSASNRTKVKVLSLTGIPEIKSSLAEFEEKTGIAVTLLPKRKMVFTIESGRVEFAPDSLNLHDFDFVWLHCAWDARDITYGVNLLLNHLNIPHNKVESDQSKLTDLIAIALKGLAIPKTYFARNISLRKSYDKVKKYLGEPFIIKPCRGTWGQNIHLIHSEPEFNEVVPTFPLLKPFVCQQFIPNNFDYRVNVGFGEIASCERRIRKSGTKEFRNNAHLGADEEFFPPSELPKTVAGLAIKAAEALNLDWCGVDVLPDLEEKNYYILEVNRNPGLTLGSPEVPAALKHLQKEVRSHLFA